MTKRFALIAWLAFAVIGFMPQTVLGASAFDFEFTAIDGQALPMSTFKGKTVLVVNTATECGSTAQLGGLQKLYAAYRDKGLVVLGVPSAQFGQEPRGNKEIKNFCDIEYGVEYPMTELVGVSGAEAHPFFAWVGAQSMEPSWNFFKYLVGPDGSLQATFGTGTQPNDGELVEAIEASLAK